jgi:hypothetical protein
LRDVRFILETDHENLTYLNFEGTDKVRRWKMLVMEFNFDIKFLAGVKNNVADAFSRLCINNRLEWKHRVEAEAASAGGGIGPDAAEAEDMGDGLASELVGMLHELEDELFPIDDEVSIPEDIRAQLKLAHNAMVGHSGVQRTILKLKRLGSTFPNMRDWVDKFIKQCPVCQKEDCRTFPVGVTPFTSATYKAMQRLQVDSIGPLPTTEEGFAFVFVMIDTFTRWVMLYPLESTGGKECLRAMIQHIGIFGAPSQMVSDGGSQIVNSTIKEALTMRYKSSTTSMWLIPAKRMGSSNVRTRKSCDISEPFASTRGGAQIGPRYCRLLNASATRRSYLAWATRLLHWSLAQPSIWTEASSRRTSLPTANTPHLLRTSDNSSTARDTACKSQPRSSWILTENTWRPEGLR